MPTRPWSLPPRLLQPSTTMSPNTGSMLKRRSLNIGLLNELSCLLDTSFGWLSIFVRLAASEGESAVLLDHLVEFHRILYNIVLQLNPEVKIGTQTGFIVEEAVKMPLERMNLLLCFESMIAPFGDIQGVLLRGEKLFSLQ